MATYSLGKGKRLKSRKLIERVFRSGKGFSVFPFRVTYILEAAGGLAERKGNAGAGFPAGRGAERDGNAGTGFPAGRGAERDGNAGTMEDEASDRGRGAGAEAGTGGYRAASELGGGGTVEDATSCYRAAGTVQAGFGATRRNFKRAVDRNRIKRLTREAYRLQQHGLNDRVRTLGKTLSVFFIYTGKEVPDQATVMEKMGLILQKLINQLDRS